MNLTLIRKEYRPDGIFSDLRKNDTAERVAVTLEHAYSDTHDSEYLPKIPSGTYTCVRGQHRLHNMTHGFDTFEITGIAGHSNLLFHWGNYNSDSEGCVLLGQSKTLESNGNQMITNSKQTFNDFMNLQAGVDTFTLTVI